MARFGLCLTYANVMATVALFIALGGGAYAVSQLPANSVGSKQLQNGAVKTKKLAARAVTGAKVANNSLTGKQIRASTLGTVPNARHAHGSDLLGGIGPIGFLPSGTVRRYGPVIRGPTPQPVSSFETLLSVPPFAIQIFCSINSMGHDEARTFLTANVAHWAYAALESNGTQRVTADVATGAIPVLGLTNTTTGQAGIESASGTAVAPSGRQISYQVYQGPNIAGNTGKCVFGGTVVIDH